jgi:starch synthase
MTVTDLNMPAKHLNILFTAVEADPLIKVGGLGDVAYSLPHALRSLPPEDTGGYEMDVRLMLPFHSAIREKCQSAKIVAEFSVPLLDGYVTAQAFYTEINNLPIYLISGPLIPLDTPVYSNDHHLDGIKFTFFSLATLELARYLNWCPDIFHANDWHTAIAVYSLSQKKIKDPFFSKTHSVLSIHNMPFMGAGTEEELFAFNIQPTDDPRLPEWARHFPLPLGLLGADFVIAVSPTYARELLTPEFGCGLQDYMKSRSDTLTGIINGIDINSWNPNSDQNLITNFNSDTISLRIKNKIALLTELSFPLNPESPLLIMIGRMDPQKGVDLTLDALREIIEIPWNAVFLGTGFSKLEEDTRQMERDFPEKFRAVINFDQLLSRRMYASGDMILMPSRYEPCGLAQMIGMRYGCIPVARSTGGLSDTIKDVETDPKGTGFLFKEPTSGALISSLKRAFSFYSNKTLWSALQFRCMTEDFSWNRSARAYSKVYFELMEE